MSDLPLYPLIFTPIYREKVWGGRRLERFGRNLPGLADTHIGESWELVDLPGTSPSGGGGQAEHSVVSNGPLAGIRIDQVMERFGAALLGRLKTTGHFPLLAKYLDAREDLSVQVHPSAAYAQAHPDAHRKSEAWYIVDAEPGSGIYKGIQEGVTPEQLRQAVDSDDPAQILAMLIHVPVKAGDCHYLPSGTCHALGAGVLAAEIQTPSDTTFRVYDWGRRGRALHIDEAMQCIDFGPPQVSSCEKRSHVAGMFTTVSRLIMCDHFRIERIRMSEGYEQDIPYNQPALWMVLEGAGTVHPGNGAEPVAFERGQTLLIPAQFDDAKLALHQDTVWLEVTFPQALPEQIA